jgi:acetylornithine aminotransferase
MASGRAAGTFKPGNHGSTFGGNPLASTAALTTLNILEQDKLLEHAASLGIWIKQQLQSRLGSVKGVITVRGQGLMLGIELDKPCAEIVGNALAKGLLINVTADNVIRLLPSLVFSQAEAQQMLDILCPLVTDFLTQE